MPVHQTQPNALPLSDKLIRSLLHAIHEETGGAAPSSTVFRGEHSNDVAEIHFGNGRTLMVKRGRFAWAGPRFAASRLAAGLLKQKAGIVAPAPLGLPEAITTEGPIEAYWRIELPTLQELWATLPEVQRSAVLHSWGRLIRRVHRIKLLGYGPLPKARTEPVPLQEFLHTDLADRLLPAIAHNWADARGVVECLLRTIPCVAERAPAQSTLLHNDLHMGNVLCEENGETFGCVGLLDLEAAFAGPPEADLANLQVLHGPLFAQPLPGAWFQEVATGYGENLDPLLLGFFRAYHLLNLGFYSALIGHAEHAGQVAAAARVEVKAFGVSN